MVYVLLAEGFEEVEALTPVDLLRRAGVETRLVGVTGATVCGARGINVVTDLSMDEVDLAKADMLVLPGGMPGTTNLYADKRVTDAVRTMADAGKVRCGNLRGSVHHSGRHGSARGQESHLLSGHGGRHDGRDPGQGERRHRPGRSSPAAAWAVRWISRAS